ncbi:hypothetical protein [Jiangella mangrovi]|uniref:Secreted protein n=1 Tax=Jiangella mangrovi TaxID=1524084 RepID=A0A7W9LKP4_9ACTN|nr:hypothetical protein [Jiangella mangrovi]MBB5787316.1 hypothetical protein [Jiangella mangrovi]
MRLASRLATTGVVAAFAVGGLLTGPAQATPDRAPTTVTAQSSGTVWCTKGLADCRSKRNVYVYLGCWASPVRPAQWYPGWYQFDWRC